MDNGKPALTIDQVPLEWCFNDGVKLDFLDKADGYVCTADDMKRALDRIGYQLKPLDIVLANTSAGKAYGQPDFIDRGCGFGREATLFLLEQGVRVTGTNGWSWDAPFSYTAKRFAETGDASLIWEGHKAGREIGYCHMEKLSNLDALPSVGLQGRVLSGEDREGLGRVDAGRGDHRGLKLPPDQPVERNRPAAIDQEIERARRPQQRIFDAERVPEPAVAPMRDDREREQDEDRNAHRPGEQAERQQRPADHLGRDHDRRPEQAGPIAGGGDRRAELAQRIDRHAGVGEQSEAGAQAVRHQNETGNHSQQRLDPRPERRIKAAERREYEVCVCHLA